MLADVSPDHPRQRLLFFTTDNTDEGLRIRIEALTNRLRISRQWLLGPPTFVDTTEGREELSPGDTPLRTLGGYLELYSAHPPWTLPQEVDLRHFDEVSALVSSLREFSQQHSVAFELELDGTFVGAIANGDIDRTLELGLLGEWAKGLGV